MLHFASSPTRLGPGRVKCAALWGNETEAAMTRADLIRILTNTELEEHRNLTREQARAVVDEIFRAIKDALRNGEDVSLPVGNFEVCEQPRQPLRRWFLKRVRVTYKQRNMIKFKGDVYVMESTDQPPHPQDSNGEMKHSEIDSTPQRESPRPNVASW